MTRKIEKGYCAHNRNITEVWCEGCSYVNYGKDCHNNQLPLLKLANFTLHKQDEYVEKWRELGFEIDPAPRSPLVEYEKEEWTEAKIFKTVQKEIEKIYEEGYKYILIGGLANVMIYAYHI
ncbi:MAG: hypothetical protein FJZ11_07010, partial [Candidatus Omnitrophica bacterium]|nr:hypothetical protein [Candidatus Omnitrophota bacterium]